MKSTMANIHECERAARELDWHDDAAGLPDVWSLIDGPWSSDAARTEAMVPVAIALWDWQKWPEARKRAFAAAIAMRTIREVMPPALRAVGLKAQAEACERAQNLGEATEATRAARAAARAAAEAAVRATDEAAAWLAAGAADEAAWAATKSTQAAAWAADEATRAATAADEATRAATKSARAAADTAAWSTASPAAWLAGRAADEAVVEEAESILRLACAIIGEEAEK